MILRRLLKHRGLGINLIAGFSFLMLAVYGWGLSWEDLGSYLVVILLLLLGLIALAAACGWVLHKLVRKTDWSQLHTDGEIKEKNSIAPGEGNVESVESGTKPDSK